MGSGKRNYNAMRKSYRKHSKKEVSNIQEEIKKASPKEEDVKKLLSLWKSSQKRDEVKNDEQHT